MKSWLVVALLATACSTKQKTTATDKMYDDPGRRTEMIEATLRVFDEHPEYVDDMVRLTLRHPKTLKRQFEATARALSDDDVARMNAEALVQHPRGLERVQIATLDAAQDKPKARRAIVDAMQQRSDLAADMLVENPKELGSISKSILTKAWEKGETKEILEKTLEAVKDPKAAARKSWRPKR